MYKTYEVCCREVGLDINEPPPELDQQWVAYVAGESIPCKSMNEAMSKSSLYEKVVSEDSKNTHAAYFEYRKEKEAEGFALWKNSLRVEYFYVPDSVYNVCYTEAEIDVGELGHEALAHRIERNMSLLEKVKLIRE